MQGTVISRRPSLLFPVVPGSPHRRARALRGVEQGEEAWPHIDLMTTKDGMNLERNFELCHVHGFWANRLSDDGLRACPLCPMSRSMSQRHCHQRTNSESFPRKRAQANGADCPEGG